jgi:parvulin-like peptidyl-prolyl isomerase
MKKLFLLVALWPAVVLAEDPPKDPPKAPAPAPKKKSPNAGKKVVVERVVAVVNDAIILQSELDARLLPLRNEAMQIPDPKERERRLAKLASQMLDEMVSEELIVQAADAAKIEVEASEVQAAIDEIKQQNNFDDATLNQVLAAQGYTLANYKTELRRQVMRLRAQNQIVAPKVQITEEDVRARYDQMQRRSEAVSAVSLSHMLFKLPEHPTEQQLAEAKDKATKALTRVKSGGEDFAKVAGEVSEDDGTKATGGAIGWFQRGSMANPEWEPIVFAMEKGDVRGPISGPQGLHVFMVTDVKKTDLKSFADMKETIMRDLRRRELEKQTTTWIEDLRKKAYIDIKLR